MQRALGWDGRDERRERGRELFAPCIVCGGPLRFDVVDPLGLGRSMEQCLDPDCEGHDVHPLTREGLL